jgi:hypothetical protein
VILFDFFFMRALATEFDLGSLCFSGSLIILIEFLSNMNASLAIYSSIIFLLITKDSSSTRELTSLKTPPRLLIIF